MVQISARPKVTIAQTSRLFIGILYIAAVVIVRTINSRPKKKKKLYIFQTDFYCDFEEELHYHDQSIPTKQNNLCNYQCIWDVVQQSPDIGEETLGQPEAPDTVFEIFRQETGKFVLVLDKSVSMENQGVNRFEQLKQSTMRWIKNDINSGSELGIVSFW